MGKDKDKKKKQTVQEQKPVYSNMGARRAVLMTGFGLSIAAVILVALGALNMFVMPNMFKTAHPINAVLLVLAIGAALAFVGLVFGVAGANTNKPIARLSFFFSINAFIIAVGMLIVLLLLFKLLIPIPGLEGFVRSAKGGVALLV